MGTSRDVTSQKVRGVGFLFKSPHMFESFHKRTAGKTLNLIQRPVCKGLRPPEAPTPLPLLLENRTGRFQSDPSLMMWTSKKKSHDPDPEILRSTLVTS